MTNLPITRVVLPPGPKTTLVGSIFSMMWGRKDTLKFFSSLAWDYGDISYIRQGPVHIYSINHPDLIHDILVTQAAKFNKTALAKRGMGRFLGNGLLVSDGEFWKRQRKLVQPAFHYKRIEAYAQVMVDYTQNMLNGWQNNTEYDIDQEMMKLTLTIIARTMFDTDVSDSANNVWQALTTLQEIVLKTFSATIPMPEWVPSELNRRADRAIKVLDDLIMNIIDERRASREDKGDLLSMLLIAADDDDGGHMTDKQVRDEAMTLFLAGHETAANTLTWAWYVLSQHPHIEAKLMDELNIVLNGRPPTMQDLPNLPYTAMVIKETLRLYPPAWSTGREPIEDVMIGGYKIKKGSLILFSPYTMQRDPRFFEDPEKFDPERFTEENEKKIPRFAYFPFGGGARVCIGQQFASMEASLLLATIAQRVRLTLVPDQQVEVDVLMSLRVKHGLRMQVTQREQVEVMA